MQPEQQITHPAAQARGRTLGGEHVSPGAGDADRTGSPTRKKQAKVSPSTGVSEEVPSVLTSHSTFSHSLSKVPKHGTAYLCSHGLPGKDNVTSIKHSAMNK